jgi:ubiquinone/menaquinone biosynthesis C-methylase UbiE
MNLYEERLNEQKKYEWLSINNPLYGGTNHGKPFIEYILKNCYFPLIDIGCGRNNFTKLIKKNHNNAITAIGIDFAFKEADIICSANNIPIQNNYFNTVTSFDFFEHLLEDDVDYVIKEIIRISNNNSLFFATISSKDSVNRGPNGETLHPTIKNSDWWISKFAEFNISVYIDSAGLYQGKILK